RAEPRLSERGRPHAARPAAERKGARRRPVAPNAVGVAGWRPSVSRAQGDDAESGLEYGPGVCRGRDEARADQGARRRRRLSRWRAALRVRLPDAAHTEWNCGNDGHARPAGAGTRGPLHRVRRYGASPPESPPSTAYPPLVAACALRHDQVAV